MALLPFTERRHLETPPLELPLWAPVRGWEQRYARERLIYSAKRLALSVTLGQ
jgi:hypothetical protein